LKKMVEGPSVWETTAAPCPREEELCVKTAYPEAYALCAVIDRLKRKMINNTFTDTR